MSEYEKLKCLNCGHIGYADVETINEGTDADGNRGRYVTWVTCEECGDNNLTDSFDESAEAEGLVQCKNCMSYPEDIYENDCGLCRVEGK